MLMHSSSFTCNKIYHCQRYDLGRKMCYLSHVQQTHLWQAAEHHKNIHQTYLTISCTHKIEATSLWAQKYEKANKILTMKLKIVNYKQFRRESNPHPSLTAYFHPCRGSVESLLFTLKQNFTIIVTFLN